MPTDSPGRDLATYFYRPDLLTGPLNRPADFELHAHKAYRPASMPEVNSWVRFKTATLSATQRRIVLLEQDLNTLPSPDESVHFDSPSVDGFFSAAGPEADEIMRAYLAPTSRGR